MKRLFGGVVLVVYAAASACAVFENGPPGPCSATCPTDDHSCGPGGGCYPIVDEPPLGTKPPSLDAAAE